MNSTGTTSVQTLRKNKKAANMDFKEVFGKDHADSFLLLESGRADAFVMDDNILAGLIASSKSKMRAERTANGVPLPDDTWAAIVNTAREVGVSEASIQRATS